MPCCGFGVAGRDASPLACPGFGVFVLDGHGDQDSRTVAILIRSARKILKRANLRSGSGPDCYFTLKMWKSGIMCHQTKAWESVMRFIIACE